MLKILVIKKILNLKARFSRLFKGANCVRIPCSKALSQKKLTVVLMNMRVSKTPILSVEMPLFTNKMDSKIKLPCLRMRLI